jgi:uncharacterized RDD family membrane protein YckC
VLDDPRPPARPAAAQSPAAAAKQRRYQVDVIPPEAKAFQGQRAGLVTRVMANTVDLAVVVAVVAAGYLAVAAVRFLWNSRSFSLPTASFALLVVIGSGVMVVYLAGAWALTGRTYGDHLLGLRVVGPRGRAPGVVLALVRAALCVVFPIGLFWVAVSRTQSSVQDVLLRSAVVYDWSQRSRGDDDDAR